MFGVLEYENKHYVDKIVFFPWKESLNFSFWNQDLLIVIMDACEIWGYVSLVLRASSHKISATLNLLLKRYSC